jgi:hypothetical protein
MEAPAMTTRPISEGDDLVCKNCGCEIQVKHTGENGRGYGRQAYMCSCGTPMEFEHAPGQRPAGAGADRGRST